MGKVIVCTGRIAEVAYVFPNTRTRIYSIEELCYYFYENIYIITKQDVSEALIDWIAEQLSMKELASKLFKMRKRQANLKDLLVTILCSADYYEEAEIKQIIAIMDKLEKSTDVEREKLRADYLLRTGHYKRAQGIYEHIIMDADQKKYPGFFYGNIWNNIGVTRLYLDSFLEAANAFEEAYGNNHNIDSLSSCLICYYLAKKEDACEEIVKKYKISQSSKQELFKEIEKKREAAKGILAYQRLQSVKDKKVEGKIGEYYKGLEQLLEEWKDEYRNGLI